MLQASDNYYNGFKCEVKVVTNIKEDEKDKIRYEHKIFARKYSDFFVDEGTYRQVNSNIVSQLTENCSLSMRNKKHRIKIYVLEDSKRIDIENIIIDEMRSIMEENRIVEKVSLDELYFKALISALLSITGLTIIFSISIDASVLANVIVEVIKVGCWMFMWQALLFLTFGKVENMEKVNLLKDLYNAEVEFLQGYRKIHSVKTCQVLKGGAKEYD